MPEVPAQAKTRSSSPDWPASVQSLIGTVVIAVFVITFVVQAFQIPSESMENTLLIGDYLLVDKFCYGGGGVWDRILPYRKIQRGDIVVFHYPVRPSQHFVKRVVGIPGDRVRLIDKQVFVNGVPLREPYVRYTSAIRDLYRDDFPRVDIPAPGLDAAWWLEMRKLVEDNALIVPDGYYFVLGDNRDESLDSRYWGFVPRQNIIGRPLLIYWSIRNGDEDNGLATSPGDKLYRFYYTVTHIWQITRWDRTLHLVK
jgi:signal peptidase I